MNEERDHAQNDEPEENEHLGDSEESSPGDEPKVRFQRKDGSWESVEHKPLSDDPEVAAMGKLPWKELQEIVDDPDHPQHEHATAYARLLGERMRQSIAPLMSDVSKQYENLFRDISKSIKMPTLKLPKVDLRVMPGIRPDTFVPPVLPSPASEREYSAEPIEGEAAGELDSVTHLIDEVTRTNSLLSEQNSLLRKQAFNSAVDSGVQAVRASQEGVRSRRALTVAWAAVGATVLVGIVQIFQNVG